MKTSFLLTEEQASDQTLVLELADLIRHGSLISGVIEAPTALLETGQAIGHTGLKFSQHQEIHNPISTRPDRETKEYERILNREYEGFAAILLHSKKPGFVEFEEAGWGGFSFNQLQAIASHYLGLGYRGILHYYKGGLDRDQESFRTDSSISVVLGGLQGLPRPTHPYLIGLTAKPEATEDVFTKPVLEFCRELKLQEQETAD